jgi:simple sugar transport system ATP-binding protein
MVGRDLQDLFPKSDMAIGQPLLVVDRLSGSGLRDVSFTVHAGEIVGIFGLMGAGINTLGRVIFGATKRDEGVVTLGGARVRPNAPRDAIAKGMGLLTESRKDDGLVLPLSVRNNMTLAALGRFADLTWIRRGAETRAAADYVGRLGIKTPSLRQPIRYLSGGNQQKVLMARWLLRQDYLKLLILAEPTRGIDVGAHAEIIRLIERLCEDGLALLVISSELEEIASYSDRVVVLRDRQHVRELSGSDVSADTIMTTIASH